MQKRNKCSAWYGIDTRATEQSEHQMQGGMQAEHQMQDRMQAEHRNQKRPEEHREVSCWEISYCLFG